MSVSLFPVNRYPTALLRFLGLTGPDAPSRVEEMIRGQVDLLYWWLEANAVVGTQLVTPGVGGTGFPTLTTVPATQRWLLIDLTIGSAALPAAHTLEVVGCTRRGSPLTVFVVGDAQVAVVGGIMGLDCFAGVNRPCILLNPGEQVGAYVRQNTGATPPQLTVNYRYVPFTA